MLLAVALVFSGFQMENLLWPWAIQVMLPCLFIVGAFVCLASGWLKLTVVSALLATASMASGLWVWPVIIWQAVRLKADRSTLAQLGVWGAVTWALYLWRYEPAILGMGYQTAAVRPLDVVSLAALYFGGPVSLQPITAGTAAGWLATVRGA
jgi:hypothetical protein